MAATKPKPLHVDFRMSFSLFLRSVGGRSRCGPAPHDYRARRHEAYQHQDFPQPRCNSLSRRRKHRDCGNLPQEMTIGSPVSAGRTSRIPADCIPGASLPFLLVDPKLIAKYQAPVSRFQFPFYEPGEGPTRPVSRRLLATARNRDRSPAGRRGAQFALGSHSTQRRFAAQKAMRY